MVEKCDLLFYDPHETFLENILNSLLRNLSSFQMTSSKDISLQTKMSTNVFGKMNQPNSINIKN